MHACRETHRRRALSRCIHRSGCRLLRILEDLRLGGARIAQQQDVDVAAHAMHAAGACLFVTSTEQRQRHRGLYMAVAVYRRRDGADDAFADLDDR